jgi:hypothetical protein
MNRPYTPPANGPGGWAVRVCLATLLAGLAAAQSVELRQTSVPVGIINQTSSVTMGTVAATVTAPETSGSSTFCYWTLNAVRWADPGGTAQNPATFTVAGAVDAVAIFVPTAADTDTDGLPDWWEYRYLGDLTSGAGDNPDGDAYINSDELARGLPPNVHNLPDHGGVTRRRWITSVIQDPEHFVRLTELSNPVGVIQQTRIVPKGEPVALTNPPTPINGYYFTGWLLGTARYDRTSAWQPITVTPDADLTLVARYVKDTEDSDGDGLLDWKEWLWFEGLQYDNTSDPDLDGFSVAEEEQRGLTSLANDELAHGGLSRRRAASIYVDTTGRLPFQQASDPATILDRVDYYPAGSLVTVPSREGHISAGYQFTWWDLNGERQADASGAALPGFSFALNNPSTATAYYIDPNIDTDGDGIKDWFEWTYFGSLVHNSTSDPDGDGFDITTEVARNQAAQVFDELAHGGLSRRRSGQVFASTVGHLALRTTSNPVSILMDLQYHLPGTVVTVPDKSGSTYANYQFSSWTLNGVRQADPSGVALGGFQFAINTPSDLLGNYIDPAVDTDGDGIKDWHEWTYYGTLANGPDSDTDGDGFNYADDLARGQSPRVIDELVHGGVSRRRVALFTVNPVVAAGPPEIGELQATNITATTATLNARINALSSATTANFEYGTTPAFGKSVASVSILNGFVADTMSAPLTGLLPAQLYYYRVIASNSSGTTISETATFRTLGARTGYEQWALIYSITDPNGDEEKDGVENLVEYAFGMHPRLCDLWRLPQIELINGRFRLSVTAPAGVDDVVYGAEYSTDLKNWTALPDTGSGTNHEFLTPLALVGNRAVYVRWVIRLQGAVGAKNRRLWGEPPAGMEGYLALGLFGRGAFSLGFGGLLLAEPGAARHFHAAFFIDTDAFGGDQIALLDDVLDMLRAAFGQFGDVDQAVLAGEYLHERAEGGDGHDLAGVNLVDLDLLEHPLDHVAGALQTFRLGGVDVHRAVVLNVDLGARLGLDALDVLAAGPDEFADPIRRDLDGDDPRRVRAEFAVSRDRLGHFRQHFGPAGLGDENGFLQHGEREPRQLEVELVTGDSFAGAAQLEVHVAVEVFRTDDVEQHLVRLERAIVVGFGDQANRDAADRAGERHTGVEQRHGAGANRGHGGGAVGLGDFRRHADRVGEIGLVRDHRFDRALGERAVADFAAVDAAHAAGFTDGEGRKVVMQDEALAVLAARVVVEILLFVGRGQGGDGQRLGLATGENGGAVDARQRADFPVQRPQVADCPAIGTDALVHDGDAERLLLQVFKRLLDIKIGGFRRAGLDGGLDFVAEGADLSGPFGFVRSVDRALDPVAGDFVGDFKEVFLGEDRGEFAFRLAGEADEFLLGGDEFDDRLLGEMEGLDEFLLGKFVGLALDHDDVGLVADVDEVEVAVFAFGVGRVDNELAIHAADAHGADGAGKGNIGDAEGGGRAVHGEDVRIILAIRAEEDGDDLGVVEIAFWEQRPERAVGHPAGEDFLFGGAAFAFEVTAREDPGGGGFFLVFN